MFQFLLWQKRWLYISPYMSAVRRQLILDKAVKAEGFLLNAEKYMGLHRAVNNQPIPRLVWGRTPISDPRMLHQYLVYLLCLTKVSEETALQGTPHSSRLLIRPPSAGEALETVTKGYKLERRRLLKWFEYISELVDELVKKCPKYIMTGADRPLPESDWDFAEEADLINMGFPQRSQFNFADLDSRLGQFDTSFQGSWDDVFSVLEKLILMRIATIEIAMVGGQSGFSFEEVEEWFLHAEYIKVPFYEAVKELDSFEAIWFMTELVKRDRPHDIYKFLEVTMLANNRAQCLESLGELCDELKMEQDALPIDPSDLIPLSHTAAPEAWRTHVQCLRKFIETIIGSRPPQEMWALVKQMETSIADAQRHYHVEARAQFQ